MPEPAGHPLSPLVPLADVLDLLEKRAQIEAPNAAAALRWAAKLAVQKWGSQPVMPAKNDATR